MIVFLKEHLPVGIFERLKRIVNGSLALKFAVLREASRFNKYYARHESKNSVQVAARLTFYTHQIEKGLSHQNFRYGFGHRPLQYLAELLPRYIAINPEYSKDIIYLSALAAVHEYIVKHEGHDSDIEYVRQLFTFQLWEAILQSSMNYGGSFTITAESKQNNRTKTYTELAEGRHSVREYADTPVTYDELKPALQIAMRTPSVCNRQPARIHVILNHAIIEEALRIQGGFNGYPTPPALILITADNRVFMSQQEHNEGYTDGGLFGMSLLLALEEQQLAACPLNTMFRATAEKKTRKLLHIPDYENLVMYIAIGHFAKESKTCRSVRKSYMEITTCME